MSAFLELSPRLFNKTTNYGFVVLLKYVKIFHRYNSIFEIYYHSHKKYHGFAKT